MPPVKSGDLLTVVYHEEPIGWVLVDEPYPTHFFGQYRPGPDESPGQRQLARAMELSHEVEQASGKGDDYLALSTREQELTREMTAAIRIPELSAGIEEFAIHHSGEVEVTLKPMLGDDSP